MALRRGRRTCCRHGRRGGGRSAPPGGSRVRTDEWRHAADRQCRGMQFRSSPALQQRKLLALAKVVATEYQGAQAALWEVDAISRTTCKELNDLNLQMTKMPFPHPRTRGG